MKVFVAVKVPRGDEDRERTTAILARVIQQAGHSAWIAFQEIARRGLSPAQFMPFMRQQIENSDLVIVAYDPDLRGGLIEEGIAYACGTPIWLLHKAGQQVSGSALACSELSLEYHDLEELESLLQGALKSANFHCSI